MPGEQRSNWFAGRVGVLSRHFQHYENSRRYEGLAHLTALVSCASRFKGNSQITGCIDSVAIGSVLVGNLFTTIRRWPVSYANDYQVLLDELETQCPEVNISPVKFALLKLKSEKNLRDRWVNFFILLGNLLTLAVFLVLSSYNLFHAPETCEAQEVSEGSKVVCIESNTIMPAQMAEYTFQLLNICLMGCHFLFYPNLTFALDRQEKQFILALHGACQGQKMPNEKVLIAMLGSRVGSRAKKGS
jgi:hypothetical protein